MDYQEYLRYRNDILEWIGGRLKKSRYQHTLGVEQTAVTLARKFGADPNLASLAALLHDNAKNLDLEQQLAICKKSFPKKYNLTMDYANILHAFAGAVEARNRYSLLPEEVFSSICYHTTGRPEMTLMDKIIYCADFIEPGRPSFEGLSEARKLVYENLDEGLLYIMTHTFRFVAGKGKKVHPLTLEALAYYHVIKIPLKKKTNKGQ